MTDDTLKALDNIHLEFNKKKSSMIRSITYYPNKVKGNLTIKFKTNDSEYTYFDVPFDIFSSLVSSDSVGKYFSKNIKGHYKFEEADDNDFDGLYGDF